MEFHPKSVFKECEKYPYVGRVSVGEHDRVDFIYQFVKERFISNLYSNLCSSVFYTAGNITGIPMKFQKKSTNVPEIFDKEKDMKKGISLVPWQYNSLTRMVKFLAIPKEKFNYIDIEFHEAVYPIRVSIYEIYPGNVIKIWAQDYTDNQWFLIWEESIRFVLSTSRLFSPPLKPCYFKTKRLKLQFRCNVNYHSILDAVMLIGTSELIFPKNSEKSITEILQKINCMHFHHEAVHNLTENLKNAHLDIDILQKNFSEYCESNVGKDFHESFRHEKVCGNAITRVSKLFTLQASVQSLLFYKKCWNSEKYSKCIDLSSDKSKELSHYNLSMLPDEMILEIFKKLDVTPLCRMNQVNKRFNNLTQDPYLYTRLNIRYVHSKKIIFHAFHYFTSRCKYLKQLDLTSNTYFDVKYFVEFLDKCGRSLTHLRFRECQFANGLCNIALLKISEICKNLKELDLQYCYWIHDKEFSYLANLNNLEFLNLSHTYINTPVLCKILESNPQIRELHLEDVWVNFDAVAKELRNSCKKLETINLFMTRFITSDGVEALADCKNLRKINFQNHATFTDNSLCKLFSSCQYLEEIHLFKILTDYNLVLLTQCKNLKRLYLCKELVTPTNYSIILKKCSNLQEIYFIHCNISDCMINQWRKEYSNVSMYTYVNPRLSYPLDYPAFRPENLNIDVLEQLI